jgi:outer membrane lipoprotein-sorting protein
MKKLIPLSLAVAVLLTVLAGSSPTRANAQGAGVVSAILNKMERNRRDIRSLRASISMEKYNSQLGEKDKYEGVVAYVPAVGRSANVRVEWRSPRREILTVADGRYTVYNIRQKVAYEGSARSGSGRNKAGSMMELMNMSSAQIKSRFDAQYAGDENLWGGVNTWHLKIMPKGASSFKYAEIWVDSSTGDVVQTKVVEKNDDSTTVRLMNLQKNVDIPSDEFRQQLGGDVKRVKS